ncbi:hypothetical protein AUK40_00990 [Candidatus Wirthbacteria bacterium CG2_30_54_11]|uniref:SCP domain-containing protein n=1 Tax=Candidatus Wirthbacteria bacterium CG2_30_54_11 TaxID=1817892 RepID=A0A1J5J376_9BACT|nr:MAG: hypothetical protein AUK40_00990 [Candidatus Wirthbacteria bacterium CG2_30_54_11]
MRRKTSPLRSSIQRLLICTLGTLICITALAARPSWAADAAAMMALHNSVRTEAGLEPLQSDGQLTYAAQKKAEDMLTNQYFAHTSPAGVTPWNWIKSSDYGYDYAGENLSIDFDDAASAFSAWMDSPSHRDNILNRNFSDIGFGVSTGTYEGRETTVMVVMFGHRSTPAADETPPGGLAGMSAKPPTRSPPRDTTSPEPPHIRSPLPDTYLSSELCDITGEAEALSTVTLYNHGEYWAETTADPDGAFIIRAGCTDGIYSIAAIAADAAENQSRISEAISFTVDTTAPQVDPDQREHFSKDVLQTHTFLTRIRLLEPATGLTGSARIGNETFNLTPNDAEQALELLVTSPDTLGELSINFTLTDAAGNTLDLPAGYTTVITSYEKPAAELPLQKIKVLWAGLHFPPGPTDALKVALLCLFSELSVVGTAFARKARARVRN